jgi:hypothetical protein
MFSLDLLTHQALQTLDAAFLAHTPRYFDTPTARLGANPISSKRMLGRLLLLVLLVVGAGGQVCAQAPAWQWASRPGAGIDIGVSTTTDASGNVYVTGGFTGSATFGTTTLTCGGNYDVFVAKLTSNGTYQWAVRAGGIYNQYGSGIAVDGSGNVVVTGWFSSPTINFGTTRLLNTSGGTDVFVAKLSPAGVWQWATSARGGRDEDLSVGIALDGSGSATVAGNFNSPTLSFGTTTLTNAGTSNDIFVAKLSPTGTWQWATRVGAVLDDNCSSVTVDASGNSVVIGRFQSPAITFGITTLTNANGADGFVAKLNPAGTWQWATAIIWGSNDDDGLGVAVDASGNTLVTGEFVSPAVTFGTTTLTNTNADNTQDIFVAKLGPTGVWQWATSVGGSGQDSGNSVAVDANGDVLITGGFNSPLITFGTATLTNPNPGIYNYDIFAAKLNSAGAWQWATRAGGDNLDVGVDVVVGNGGNVIVAGKFVSPTLTFGATTLTNANSPNPALFLASLNSTTGLPEAPDQPPFAFSPNPASTTVQLTGATGATATLLDGLGRVVGSAPVSPAGTATLNVRGLPAGLYLLRAGGATRRLVVE